METSLTYDHKICVKIDSFEAKNIYTLLQEMPNIYGGSSLDELQSDLGEALNALKEQHDRVQETDNRVD